MEKLLGGYTTEAMAVFQFVMGEPHMMMALTYGLMTINGLTAAYKSKKINILGYSEKLLAYTVTIVLGHILDVLAVNQVLGHVFGWEGSAQLAFCVYLMSKESAVIKNNLFSAKGVHNPLVKRWLKNIDLPQGEEPDSLSARMETFERELAELQQKKEERE